MKTLNAVACIICFIWFITTYVRNDQKNMIAAGTFMLYNLICFYNQGGKEMKDFKSKIKKAFEQKDLDLVISIINELNAAELENFLKDRSFCRICIKLKEGIDHEKNQSYRLL